VDRDDFQILLLPELRFIGETKMQSQRLHHVGSERGRKILIYEARIFFGTFLQISDCKWKIWLLSMTKVSFSQVRNTFNKIIVQL
jgi:hypothetical protein